MKSEVEFYRIASTHRVQLSQLQHAGETLRAALYVNFAATLAESFGISDFPCGKIDAELRDITADLVRAPLFQLESYMTTLYAKNIFEIDGDLKANIVDLDENWKSKASAFVQHIREIVHRAGLEPVEHERIMSRVTQLQSEIDRRRTRIEAVTDLWLVLTEAIGKGAKNLEPATALISKIGGAFSGLRRAEREEQNVRQLPAPETLGLPDPSETTSD